MQNLTLISSGLILLTFTLPAVADPDAVAGSSTEATLVDLQVGAPAPMFESIDHQGRPWNLREHLGKKYVAVYFYPADFTTGCIRQAQSFRDTMNLLADLGVEVVGVSGDSVGNHRLFRESWMLNFTLLADERGEVAARFGVPAKGGGRVTPRGPDGEFLTDENGERLRLERKATFERWTFLIGKDGKILYKNTKVQPAADSKQLLEFVEKLERSADLTEAEAIEEIRNRRGQVEVDELIPAHPAIQVKLLGCNVKDDELVLLKPLIKVRTLYLGHSLSDAGLQHLAGLTEVETLTMTGAPITGAGLVHLRGMTKLQTLDLDATNFDDSGLVFLKEFKHLKVLNLAQTRITNRALETLSEMTSLESLNLDFVEEELTDEAIAQFARLTRLKTLILNGSALTDAGLESLKSLTNLETLEVEVTPVTSAGVADFRKALPKVTIAY